MQQGFSSVCIYWHKNNKNKINVHLIFLTEYLRYKQSYGQWYGYSGSRIKNVKAKKLCHWFQQGIECVEICSILETPVLKVSEEEE